MPWVSSRIQLLVQSLKKMKPLNVELMTLALVFPPPWHTSSSPYLEYNDDDSVADVWCRRYRLSNSYFGYPCFPLSQVCGLGGVHSIFTLVTLHLLVTTVFATLGDKYWNSWLVAGSQGVSLLLQAVRAIWGWGWSATAWWKSSTKLGQWYDGIRYALQALSSRLWVWQADVDGEQLSEIIRLQSRKPW